MDCRADAGLGLQDLCPLDKLVGVCRREGRAAYPCHQADTIPFAVVSGFCDLDVAAAVVRLDRDQLVRGVVEPVLSGAKDVANCALGGARAVGRHLAQSLS